MTEADRSISVECLLPITRDAAFELFVDRFAEWWPKDYTFSGDNLQDIGMEPMLGGACYEQTRGGHRMIWGTVLSIERPLYIRLAWQISPDRRPIADPAAASRVMVTFWDAGTTTRLELVHSEFVRHGDGAEAYRQALAAPEGWPYCLERLRESAAAL